MAAMQTRAHSGHSPNLIAARELTIDEHHAGQRIDNFLMSCLKGLPRTRIYRILRRGEVRVNKGRIRQHYRLKSGDVVRIPPLRLTRPVPSRGADAALCERVEACILFEDRGLIVVDKPSGVAVHGGSGLSHGIIEALRAARGERHYLELVHRLDRDTSGCLMIAKRRPVLTGLHAAFRDGKVRKRYQVLLKGHWRGPARVIETGLLRNALRSGERLVRVDAAGKTGRTRFVPRALGNQASLMEALPFTGRTHQIRVHAASAGHPVAGDPKYGERDFNRAMRGHGLRRLFLHAASLSFENPGGGAMLTVEAPLPVELLGVLASLGLRDGALKR
jgi:23S rRNA pseudouridine955/2504/2580 synthase